jgi:hypothetical protein
MSLSRFARLLALSSLLLLAAGPGAATAAPKASPNLLDNPGFEEPLPGHPWMPAGWDTAASGLMSVFFGRDTFLVHSGRYAVSVANLSTMFFMAFNWNQGLIVDRNWWGKDVVFSMWTRSNGLQGRAYIRAAIYRDSLSKMAKIWGVSRLRAADSLRINTVDDPMLELGWTYKYFMDNETDWVRREVRLHIPPTTTWLRLSAGLTGTGQVLFDDASLTLEPARPPDPAPVGVNLLADPGFEGDGTLWEYSMPPYEGQRVERDTTLSHSGKACMRYQDTGGGFNQIPTGACQALVNRGLAGKHMRLSAWLKTDSLQGTANVALFFKTIDGPRHPVPKLYSGTNDWTHISVEGDAPPDTYEVWAWFLYQSPAPGRVYFDDVSLEVTGDAPKPPPPPKPAPSPDKKKR